MKQNQPNKTFAFPSTELQKKKLKCLFLIKNISGQTEHFRLLDQTKLSVGSQRVGLGSEWPTHDMEGPSSDPNHPSKGTCAPKDRVLTTWLHGNLSVCIEYLTSQRYRFAQWRAHIGEWAAQTLFHFSQIFIYTAQNISSRRDVRKQLPRALLSRTWSSGALPHHIQCKRQLSIPLP